MYRDACEATQRARRAVGRGPRPAHGVPRRARVENVRALADVFADADADVVVNAVERRRRAAAPRRLRRRRARCAPSSSRPTIRRRASGSRELREELARVTAIRDAGRCAGRETRGVDAHRGRRARRSTGRCSREALNVVGFLGNFCVDPETVRSRASKEAYDEAVAGHDDEARHVLGVDRGDLSRESAGAARRGARLARDRARLPRSPDDREYVLGPLLTAEGDRPRERARRPTGSSRRRARPSRRRRRRTGPTTTSRSRAWRTSATRCRRRGRYDEAVAADETALAAHASGARARAPDRRGREQQHRARRSTARGATPRRSRSASAP